MGSQHSTHQLINKTPAAATTTTTTTDKSLCKKATIISPSSHVRLKVPTSNGGPNKQILHNSKGGKKTTNKWVHSTESKTLTTTTTAKSTTSTKQHTQLLNGTQLTDSTQAAEALNGSIAAKATVTSPSAPDKLISTLDKKVKQLVRSRYPSFKGLSNSANEQSKPKTTTTRDKNGTCISFDHNKRHIEGRKLLTRHQSNDRKSIITTNGQQILDDGDVFIYPPNYRDLNECQKCERDNKICNCIQAELPSSEVTVSNQEMSKQSSEKDCQLSKKENEKKSLTHTDDDPLMMQKDEEEEYDNPIDSSGEQSIISDSWRSSSNGSGQSVDEPVSPPAATTQQQQQQFERVYKISITTAVIDQEKNRLELSAPRFISAPTTKEYSQPAAPQAMSKKPEQRSTAKTTTTCAILSTSHAAQILPCLIGHAGTTSLIVGTNSIECLVGDDDDGNDDDNNNNQEQTLVRSRAKSIPTHQQMSNATAHQKTQQLQVASLSSITECIDSLEQQQSTTNSTKTLLTSSTTTLRMITHLRGSSEPSLEMHNVFSQNGSPPLNTTHLATYPGEPEVTCKLSVGDAIKITSLAIGMAAKKQPEQTSTIATTSPTRRHRKVHQHKLSRQAILDDTDEEDGGNGGNNIVNCQKRTCNNGTMAMIDIASNSELDDNSSDSNFKSRKDGQDEYSPILTGVRDYIENVHSSELKLHPEPTTVIVIDPSVVSSSSGSAIVTLPTTTTITATTTTRPEMDHHLMDRTDQGTVALTMSTPSEISSMSVATTSLEVNINLESAKKSIFDGASRDEILEYLEDARERVPEVLIAADEVMVIGENELILVNQLEPGSPAPPISIVEPTSVVDGIDDQQTISPPQSAAGAAGIVAISQAPAHLQDSIELVTSSGQDNVNEANHTQAMRLISGQQGDLSHLTRKTSQRKGNCGGGGGGGVQISASQIDSLDSVSRLTMSFDERASSPSDDYRSLFTSGTQESSIDSNSLAEHHHHHHQRCFSDSSGRNIGEYTSETEQPIATSGLQRELTRAKMAISSLVRHANLQPTPSSLSSSSQRSQDEQLMMMISANNNNGSACASSPSVDGLTTLQISDQVASMLRHSPRLKSNSESSASGALSSGHGSPRPSASEHAIRMMLLQKRHSNTTQHELMFSSTTSSTSSSGSSSSSSPPPSSSSTSSPTTSSSAQTSGNCSATSNNFYASPSLSCSSPFLAHLAGRATTVTSSTSTASGFQPQKVKLPPALVVQTLTNPARCLPNYEADLSQQSNSPTGGRPRLAGLVADTAVTQRKPSIKRSKVEHDDSALEVEFSRPSIAKIVLPTVASSPTSTIATPPVAVTSANNQLTTLNNAANNNRLSVIDEQILEKSPTRANVEPEVTSNNKAAEVVAKTISSQKNNSSRSSMFSAKSFLSTSSGGNSSSSSSSLTNKISNNITRPLHSHYATINRLNNYLISRPEVMVNSIGNGVGGSSESMIEFQCLDCDQFTVTDQARVLHKANELRLLRESEIGSLEQQQRQQTNNQMTLDQIDRAYVAALNGLPLCKSCEKKRGERKEIVSEFVDTELKYGRDLKIIHDEFYRPMQIAGLLNKDQLEGIFLNLSQLILVHCKFAERLERAVSEAHSMGDTDYNSVNIGRLFVESSDMLHTFELYCIRQGSAACLLARLAKEKELLRIFLRVSQMENTLLRRMNLAAFLMSPVQRVTKYPLLLNRLYKVTPYHHKDREALRDAQLKVELHLEHINQQTKGSSATNKIWRRISNLSGPNYSAQQAAANRRGLISAEDIGYIKLRKSAIELLKWDRDEMQFIHSGKIDFAPLNEYLVKQKAKSIRYMTAHALLIVSGKPNWKYRPDLVKSSLDSKLLVPTPGGSGVKEAALLLFREKNGRFVACREPILLSNCVLSNDCSLFNSELPHHNQQQQQQQQQTVGPTGANNKTAPTTVEISANAANKSQPTNRRLSPGLMSFDTPTMTQSKKDLATLNEFRAASADQSTSSLSSTTSSSQRNVTSHLMSSLKTNSESPDSLKDQKSLCSKRSNASATSDLTGAGAQGDTISMSSLKSLPDEKTTSGSLRSGDYSPPIQTSRSYSLASALPRAPIMSSSNSSNTKTNQTASVAHSNSITGNPTILNQLITKVNNYHHKQQQQQQQVTSSSATSVTSAKSINNTQDQLHKAIGTSKTHSANACIESSGGANSLQSNSLANSNHKTVPTNLDQLRGSSSNINTSGALSDSSGGGGGGQFASHHHYYHNHNPQPYGDYEESFELHERLTKESLLLRADTPLKTRYWLQMLRYHAKDLGHWRTRRHGLANIMMMRQE